MAFQLVSAALVASSAANSLAHSATRQPNLQDLHRLRGGSALTTSAAGLFAVSGAAGWVTPAANLGKYGFSTEDESAKQYMRQAGAWQLASSMVLQAGLGGALPAATTALYAGAATVLASIPVNEYFERSKSEAFGGVVALATLGKLVAVGKVGPSVAGVVLSCIGLLIHFTPKDTAVLYGIKEDKRSTLLYSMISLMGQMICVSGFYVASLAYGLTQARALAFTLLANALFALKFAFTDAVSLGAPKSGPLVWSVVQGVLAALALK